LFSFVPPEQRIGIAYARDLGRPPDLRIRTGHGDSRKASARMADVRLSVVIPGQPRERLSPESITTNVRGDEGWSSIPDNNPRLWLWIPGSMLRIAPE
jgi:hypothetical protein